LSTFDVELAIENVTSHKSPGIDQIPAEVINNNNNKVHRSF
jgi:hypothetical protein